MELGTRRIGKGSKKRWSFGAPRCNPHEYFMIVDTNIVSYFFRKDTRSALYEPHLKGRLLYIAFMTVAELYKWPFERKWTEAKKAQLTECLKSYVVLPYDDQLAWKWAELTVQMKSKGQSMAWGDSWIAATAIRHDMPLATHNRKHFESVPGLKLISEN